MKICALIVLHFPASLFQRRVNVCTRLTFRGLHCVHDTRFPYRNHPASLGKF
jgi:hypothetical protein